MYNKFFGLAESPFRITPDPRFLYLGPAHREALATLIYGIRERKGIVALTGGVGTGKTTLLEGLFERLASDCTFVRIRDPKADFSVIVRELLVALGLSSSGIDRSEAMNLLWERLSAPESLTINPVLVIDEAQDVRDDVLEDFRLLSNLETHDRKLIQMLLVGQPEFRRRLDAATLEPLRQRIALSATIHPLTLAECTAYVKHRLEVAGAEPEGIFAIGAFEAIHDYARGIPRLINVVCDGALSMGYATGTRPIHAGLVREVVQDLRGEGAPLSPPSHAAPQLRNGAARPQQASEGARGRAWVTGAAAACALVLGGAVVGPPLFGWRHSPPASPQSSHSSSRAVAASRVPEPPLEGRGSGEIASRGDPVAPPTREGSEAPTWPAPPSIATPGVGAPSPETARIPERPASEAAAVEADNVLPAPEPHLEGVPEVRAEPPPLPEPATSRPEIDARAQAPEDERESLAAVKRARELERQRERDDKSRAAKEAKEAKAAKEKAARERLAKAKPSASPDMAARESDAGDQTNGGGVESQDVAADRKPDRLAVLASEPARSSPTPRPEPRMLIVPDGAEQAAATPSTPLALKVRELYASHKVGVPEASPRFVPGDTVQLVAVYDLANAPVGGGDVSIDLWVRGPSQEDLPSLGARRVLQGKSGTFQAAVGRKIPANAPSGVYGLVARVSVGGTEARRVFLFRVD